MTLKVELPWDKLSDFLRGVILPLHQDGAGLRIEVRVEASSPQAAIKRSTLEQKVNETLNQLAARILEHQVE